MIKHIIICDCCQKEVDFFYASIEKKYANSSTDPAYDLCKECYYSFVEWIKKRLNEVKE